MAKRGRPSLNLTPEERIQRRRLQLVASQRKRRAHKRLALQLSKPSPEPDAEPDAPPSRPDEAALCRYYDAFFRDEDEAVTLSNGNNAMTAEPDATAKTTSRTTTNIIEKTSTRTVSGVAQTMPSSDHHAPFAGSWVNNPSAEPGKLSTSQASFASEHLAPSDMPLLGSVLDPLHGFDLGSHLLGQSATASYRKLTVKARDNVFLPGRFSEMESEWMPTNSNEPSYSHRHIKPYHRRPPSPSSQDSGPALSSFEAADLSAPWAGTKQVSLLDDLDSES